MIWLIFSQNGVYLFKESWKRLHRVSYCPVQPLSIFFIAIGSQDQCYETSGFHVIVGCDLTECAPLLSYRRLDGNLVTAGCCDNHGWISKCVFVDPESKAIALSDRPALPHGEMGVVIGRGSKS
jgi:hypothetical protein